MATPYLWLLNYDLFAYTKLWVLQNIFTFNLHDVIHSRPIDNSVKHTYFKAERIEIKYMFNIIIYNEGFYEFAVKGPMVKTMRLSVANLYTTNFLMKSI